jgi:hypothetical protein
MEDRVQLVPMTLADGTVVRVGARALGGDENVVDWAEVLPFSEVTRTIEGVARDLAACLDRVKPEKTTVEFGVEIAIESGKLTALLVNGAAKGNLTITLEWGSKAE